MENQQVSEQAQLYMNPVPTVGLRIWSMILSALMISCFFLLLLLPLLIADLYFIFFSGTQKVVTGYSITHFYTEYSTVLLFAIYLSKDILNGRSFSKKTLRLQVVDNKTGELPSPIKTVIRNLTLLIWPVEFIMACINPSRRIGDYLANTRLERYSPLTIPSKKYTFAQVLPAFALAFLICFIATIPFQTLFRVMWK